MLGFYAVVEGKLKSGVQERSYIRFVFESDMA
jgi:hypothetical protein